MSKRRDHGQNEALDSHTQPDVLPVGLDCSATANGLVLGWRWRRTSDLILVASAVIVDAVLVGWFANAGEFDWLLWLTVPIVIALNYVVVARLLNRTQIHVGADGLRIRVLPIPWWTNQRLASERIISIGTESRPTAFNPGALTAFEVIARTQHGPVRLFRYADVDSVAVDNLAKRMQGALDRDEARPVETATE